jgi:cyclase
MPVHSEGEDTQLSYLIDTHYHGDHTGGNALFHKDGAIVVAHENIRVRLAAGDAPMV